MCVEDGTRSHPSQAWPSFCSDGVGVDSSGLGSRVLEFRCSFTNTRQMGLGVELRGCEAHCVFHPAHCSAPISGVRTR